jgi:hypothetical protein
MIRTIRKTDVYKYILEVNTSYRSILLKREANLEKLKKLSKI